MTTPVDVPATSVQVMSAGTALSPDTAQFLASEIGITASRERDRRLAVVVLGPLAIVIVACAMFLYGGRTLNIVFASVTVGALSAFAGTAWGIRNRALLDQAAHDTGVPPSALVAAVRLVRRGTGPSAALRTALDASSSSTSWL